VVKIDVSTPAKRSSSIAAYPRALSGWISRTSFLAVALVLVLVLLLLVLLVFCCWCSR